MDLQSGLPLSLIQHGLLFNYPKLEKSIRTDVVVVGGGISGALVSYYLTRAGINCVTVDGRTVGLGSTCASTSIIQYEIDQPLSTLIDKIGYKNAVRAYQDCQHAIQKLASISQRIGFADFKFNDSVYFAAFKKHLPFLRTENAARQRAGINTELIGEGELKTLFGFDAPAAIRSKNAAYADAYLMTHHLHQFNIRAGNSVYDRTFIKKFNYKPSGVTLYTAENHLIHAKRIVLATGYEAVNYIRKKMVSLHSTYATASEMMVEKAPIITHDVILWNTANPYLYMRGTKDGRVIVGGRDELFFSPAKRDALIRQKTKLLVNDYQKMFHGKPFEPEFSWAGTFGSTKDGLPFIGTFGNKPRRYFALGFGGNGITFSVIAAELIRDSILGRRHRSEQLYSFHRFK
jgi:glycine/D-amino acid oxidase-like deaminating enzyme